MLPSGCCPVRGYRGLLRCEQLLQQQGGLLQACVGQHYFMRTAEEEGVLLALYVKAKTDNTTGAKPKEIRRAPDS
jgi:hypothetical protein